MSSFEKTTSNTTTIPFHNNIIHKRRAKTPSFSSVLLDAIYHSIDDTETDTNSSPSQHNYTPATSTTTTNNKLSDSFENGFDFDYIQPSKQKRNKMRSGSSSLETIDLRHAIMIDSWIENQPPQPQPQQQSQAYYYRQNNDDHINIKFVRQKSISNKSRNTALSSPTSSSSSSCCFTQQRIESCLRLDHTRKRESSSKIFNKTKLKALKIYDDLKKTKQRQQQQQQQSPVSPGARIAAFLNSMFKNSENTQLKNKMSTTNPTSECSSASSFARSCLSKATISTEKSIRSVRFYPVNTIVFDDEYSSACSHKAYRTDRNQHERDHQKLLDSSNAAFNHQRQRTMLVDEDSRTRSSNLIPTKRNQVNVDDQKLPDSSKAAFNHQQQRTAIVNEHSTTRKLTSNVDDQKLYNSSKGGFENQQQQCRKIKREKEIDALMMIVTKRGARKSSDSDDYEEILSIEMSLDEELMKVDDDNDGDDNDNEDGESCNSSDLFELENLSSKGVGAFSQELPVFGTTSLKNLTS